MSDDIEELVAIRPTISSATHPSATRISVTWLSTLSSCGAASASDFNGQEFLDRASGLGIHFGDELVLLVTRPDAGLEMTPDGDLIRELVHACRAVLAETDRPGVVGRVEDLVVLVAGLERSQSSSGGASRRAAGRGLIGQVASG